jgi:hypothetical protein
VNIPRRHGPLDRGVEELVQGYPQDGCLYTILYEGYPPAVATLLLGQELHVLRPLFLLPLFTSYREHFFSVTGLAIMGFLGNSKIVRHDRIRWEHAPERFTGQCTSS